MFQNDVHVTITKACYFYLYHAFENTANQNRGKPLYIRRYLYIPSNIPIMRRAYVALILCATVYLLRVCTDTKTKHK